jgi:hypothetical protein
MLKNRCIAIVAQRPTTIVVPRTNPQRASDSLRRSDTPPRSFEGERYASMLLSNEGDFDRQIDFGHLSLGCQNFGIVSDAKRKAGTVRKR